VSERAHPARQAFLSVEYVKVKQGIVHRLHDARALPLRDAAVRRERRDALVAAAPEHTMNLRAREVWAAAL
jgi:hypothetical protein